MIRLFFVNLGCLYGYYYIYYRGIKKILTIMISKRYLIILGLIINLFCCKNYKNPSEDDTINENPKKDTINNENKKGWTKDDAIHLKGYYIEYCEEVKKYLKDKFMSFSIESEEQQYRIVLEEIIEGFKPILKSQNLDNDSKENFEKNLWVMFYCNNLMKNMSMVTQVVAYDDYNIYGDFLVTNDAKEVVDELKSYIETNIKKPSMLNTNSLQYLKEEIDKYKVVIGQEKKKGTEKAKKTIQRLLSYVNIYFLVSKYYFTTVNKFEEYKEFRDSFNKKYAKIKSLEEEIKV